MIWAAIGFKTFLSNVHMVFPSIEFILVCVFFSCRIPVSFGPKYLHLLIYPIFTNNIVLLIIKRCLIT
jgi:hypothetical protein